MARKPKEPVPTPYDDRPLQYRDLSSEGQAVVDANMADWGKAKTNVGQIRSTLETRKANAEAAAADVSLPESKQASAAKTASKTGLSIAALDKVEPRLKDARVTLTSAQNRRVTLTRKSAARASQEAGLGLGDGSKLRAAGVGWYFDHRSDLNQISETHDISQDRIVTGSAVMSPNNSPANEKAAIGALAHLHSSNPKLQFGPHVQAALGLHTNTAQFSDLSPAQAARLGDTNLREHVSGVDPDVLVNLSKGGTQGNIAKAIDVVRGGTDPSKAINPHSSPKVWSYWDSISKSQPNTPEHEEYMTRAQTALFETPGQQRLDLFGLKDSKEGILSPTKSTAEDTWQGAISSGQPLAGVRGGRHAISPAKFVASDKASTDRISKTAIINGKRVSATRDSRIGATALTHAWNNEATIRSAATLSRQSGEIIPAVLPQETGWTEARRQAGKDDDYTDFKKRTSHFAKGHQKQLPGQMSLF